MYRNKSPSTIFVYDLFIYFISFWFIFEIYSFIFFVSFLSTDLFFIFFGSSRLLTRENSFEPVGGASNGCLTSAIFRCHQIEHNLCQNVVWFDMYCWRLLSHVVFIPNGKGERAIWHLFICLFIRFAVLVQCTSTRSFELLSCSPQFGLARSVSICRCPEWFDNAVR